MLISRSHETRLELQTTALVRMKWLLRYGLGIVVATLLFFAALLQYTKSGVHDVTSPLRLEYIFAQPTTRNYAKRDTYLVDTPSCRIPDLHPYDPSTTGLIGPPKNITCEGILSLTYQRGRNIYINWTLAATVPIWQGLEYCTFQPIERAPIVGDHDSWNYGNESEGFTESVEINFSDFIRISCYNQSDSVIFNNYYAFVHKKQHVEESCQRALNRHRQDVDDNYSVLMLGVDSISRLNFHRFMPETTKFLLEKLQAVELKGYNKVADNTFINIVPLTAGKFVKELPWTEDNRSVPFDDFEFLWKQYKEKGYRTLYIEDAPTISIFDFGKAGFLKYPTHYYNRHYALAMEKDKQMWRYGGHCILDRLETEVHLHYLEQFLTTFKNVPSFAFSFLTRLTHSALEEAHYAEAPYLGFLQRLYNAGVLENTILVLYSDHGFRFGYLRETYIGKLEERLPAMFIVFPERFRRKYAEEYRNVRLNQDRLTNPFDVYQTLADVLYIGSKPGRPETNINVTRGISLFQEVPLERTCDDADILPHWCTCSELVEVSTTDAKAQAVADTFVDEINGLLANNFNECETLTLREIKRIEKMIPSENFLKFKKSKNDVLNVMVEYGESIKTYIDYQITLVTDPGGGVFEGTIRYDEKNVKYYKVGEVSRINKYGDQSHCVERHSLKKLCYCKNQKFPKT